MSGGVRIDLDGRVALITGAGSGIGEAIALLFAQAGARIVATDINAAAALDVARRIGAAGGEALEVAHDVTDEAGWRAAVDAATRRFGAVHVLVNNAGIPGNDAIVEMTLESWHRTMGINCDGVFLGMKHVIPVMPEGSAIVNVSSIYGKVGGRQHAAYSTSKGAVTMLTKCAALECLAEGRGIRVNSLHPGYVETPMFDRLDAATRAQILALHPIGRFGRPGEIAHAALFLASASSSFMTGAELVVDGGFTAQ